MSSDGLTRKERTAKYNLVGLGKNGELRSELRRKRLARYQRLQRGAERYGSRERAEYWKRIVAKLAALYGILP